MALTYAVPGLFIVKIGFVFSTAAESTTLTAEGLDIASLDEDGSIQGDGFLVNSFGKQSCDVTASTLIAAGSAWKRTIQVL